MSGVSGTIIQTGVTFSYSEVSFSKRRGISIDTGKLRQSIQYKFDPDPHNTDSWYNKNQSAFYKQVANEIITLYFKRGNAFPSFGTRIVVHNHDYDLNQR